MKEIDTYFFNFFKLFKVLLERNLSLICQLINVRGYLLRQVTNMYLIFIFQLSFLLLNRFVHGLFDFSNSIFYLFLCYSKVFVDHVYTSVEIKFHFFNVFFHVLDDDSCFVSKFIVTVLRELILSIDCLQMLLCLRLNFLHFIIYFIYFFSCFQDFPINFPI